MLKKSPSLRQALGFAPTLLNTVLVVLVVAAVAEFIGTTVADWRHWEHLVDGVVVLPATIVLALMASRLYGALPYRWLAETAGVEWWDCSGAELSGAWVKGTDSPEGADSCAQTVQEGSGGVRLHLSDSPPGSVWHRWLLFGHIGVASFRCTETSETLRQYMFRLKDLGCFLLHVPHDVPMAELEPDHATVRSNRHLPEPSIVSYWVPRWFLLVFVGFVVTGAVLTVQALHRAYVAAVEGGLWAGFDTALVVQEAVPLGVLLLLMLPKLLRGCVDGPYVDVHNVGGRPWKAIGQAGNMQIILFDRYGRVTRVFYPEDMCFWSVHRAADGSCAFILSLENEASEPSEFMLRMRKHALPVVFSGPPLLLRIVQLDHVERKPAPAVVVTAQGRPGGGSGMATPTASPRSMR